MNPTRRRAARRPLIALAVFAGAALFAAAPAQAGGEFRDGFEDQLGRLAALEVFHLGHTLLASHAAPYYEVHYVPQPRHHQKHPGRHLGHCRQQCAERCAIHPSRRLQRGHCDHLAAAERGTDRRHERWDGRGRY